MELTTPELQLSDTVEDARGQGYATRVGPQFDSALREFFSPFIITRLGDAAAGRKASSSWELRHGNVR